MRDRAAPLVGLFDISGLVERLLAPFDEMRYRDVAFARLISTPVRQELMSGSFGAGSWIRTLLRSLPGQLFRRWRQRRAASLLGRWGRAGTLVRLGQDRSILDRTLPLVRTAWKPLAVLDIHDPRIPRLYHLIPARSPRGRPSERELSALYRRTRQQDRELGFHLPEDPEWFLDKLGFAMDLLDAARLFWEGSESPGAVTLTHFNPEDQAIGWEGRRAGRRTACLHHGYLASMPYWVNGCFDVYAVWDRYHAALVRAASGGTCRALVTGHPGALFEAEARPGPCSGAKPRILLATSPMWGSWTRYYDDLFGDLCRADRPWDVIRKPHPAEAAQGRPIVPYGPRCQVVTSQSFYSLLPAADLVVVAVSGTGGEALMAGRRVLSLAHPCERDLAQWCRRFGVPQPGPGESASEAAARALQGAPPAYPPGLGSREAPARLAAVLDMIFAGHLPPGPEVLP